MNEKFRYELFHNIIGKSQMKSLSKLKLKNEKTLILIFCNQLKKVDEPLII